MTNPSPRRSVVVFVLLATLASGTAAVHATPQSGATHTLVIEQTGNNSVGYSVSVSEEITAIDNETSDSITGQTASGRVGGLPWKDTSSDNKDEIRFTGQIRDFEHDGGDIRLVLDGKQVDPSSLHNTPQESPTPTTDSSPSPTSPEKSPTHTPPSTLTSTPTPSSEGGGGWLSLNLILGISVASVLIFALLQRI